MNFNPARQESAAAPVALMGMACRFPGGSNSVEGFWRHLLSGRTAIGEIPADRFSIAAHVDANSEAPGKSYSRWGGFIDDVAGFDAAMFEISPREAQTMDPQQRLLLMVAYEAMEDGGLTRAQLGEVRTGVFVGVSASDYAAIQRQQHTGSDVYSGTGSALSIVANRLSHRFNLKGPSLAIDTACSSSLVALDQAVTALNSGRIDVAIVAGAHLLIDPSPFVAFSKAGMLSPTGMLSAFDRRANGYVRGEGIGAVLLMRQADAVVQGRRVRALVRATAANQDGRTPTLTAPDAQAQRAMMRQLIETAAIPAQDVHYVEAHGTGTPVGDPIEASAIGHVFGGALRTSPLLLGSVKPNIGHLEAAAGIASLVKAVLSLENRCVPASINFDEPNPAIAFAAHNMDVPRATTPLGAASGQPLYIAVNSFGFGGTNAGVLLESAAPLPPRTTADDAVRSVAVPISAASPEALRAVAGTLHDALAQGGLVGRSLKDVATSLGTMREGLAHRAALIVNSEAQLLSELAQLAEADAPPARHGALPAIVTGNPRPRNRLAFTYAGQGGQWPGMAQRLLVEEPGFAAAFSDFDRRFEALSGWSVRTELLRDGAASRLQHSRFAMPAIFGVQLGLGGLWQSHGIEPDFVIGHSFGELAAAHLADAIDLETATRMIHVRCQIHQRIGRDGAMLAVGMGAPEILSLLGPDSDIDLAATNSEAMVTLAGPVEAVAALSERLQRERPSVLVRAIQSDTAWHSRALAPLEDWFRAEIGEVRWQNPRLAFVSTVTGRLESRLDADYWWHNLRQFVRYRDAVLMALDLGANAFLELSPHRVLSGLNAANAAERGVSATIANSLVRNEDDFRALGVAMAQLHCAGMPIDWQAAGGGLADARDLPTYPWQLTKYWRQSEEARDELHAGPIHSLLGKRDRGPDPVWTNEVTLAGFPYLRDHVVGGDVVFPASGYFEIMLSAGRELFGERVLELEELEIASALFIGTDEHVLVSTRFDEARHRIEIRTRTRDGSAEWILRAVARLRPTDVAPDLDLPGVGDDVTRLSAGEFYGQTLEAGFGYGPAFRGVAWGAASGPNGAGEVAAPQGLLLHDSTAHPGLLDSALQLAIPIVAGDPGTNPDDGSGMARYVPKRLKRLRLSGNLPPQFSVRAQVTRDSHGVRSGSYRLADASGRCCLFIDALDFLPMGRQADAATPDTVRPGYYAETFAAFEPAPPTGIGGNCLVIATDGPPSSLLLPAGASTATLALPPPVAGRVDRLQDIRSAIAAALGKTETVLFHAQPADVTDENLVAESHRLATQLIATAQAIASHDSPVRELVVVTHGARHLPQDGPMGLAGLAASCLVGLTRTIASENPDLLVRQIDCPARDLGGIASVLAGGAGDETELVHRDDAWFVPRLVAEARADLPRGLVDIDRASRTDTFQLTMKAPGSAGGLFLEAVPEPQPAPGEVLVETAAVGLNFRDVMAVTGLLPSGAEPDPAWLNLGLEFSGTVRAIGPGVTGFMPGDRVMGMARACLRGVIAVPASTLTRLPAGLSFDEAATIPSAFATASYALVRAGRLQQGERVLIHLGTGGVGLAAIQVAQSLGAEIYATAGSEEKRGFLRGLGVAHVFNSRSLGFADDIMAATGGKGVDVVLNALPSHFIAKGIDVLAPFGRFLEIGKRDVYDDTALGMHALRHNISFNVIDLAAMGVQRTDLLSTILGEVLARFEDGTYRPLPLTRFPIDRAADAFDLMARGRHIGKVVIGLDGTDIKARAPASRDLVARRDRSYLVTGGTNGFGVEVARWLCRHGAGHIILASRSGRLDVRHDGLEAQLRALGSDVEVVALDLTDAVAVGAFIADRARSARPLAGVVHGAAVFRDGLLGQLDDASIDAVLAPKIAGAWVLHQALAQAGVELDFFLSLSSLAQVLGSLGQANYAAANSFLEGFSHYRASNGLAAQTANLGALAEAGFVAGNPAMASYLDSLGIPPMATTDVLDLLDGLTGSSAVSRSLAAMDWGRIQTTTGPTGKSPRLRGLMPGISKGDQKLRQLLETMPTANWAAVLEDFLVNEVSRVLGVDPAMVPVNRPLAELGLDSLSSIELKNRIESRLALTLTMRAFLQTPTIEKLSSVLASTLEEEARARRDTGWDEEAAAQATGENAHSALQLWAARVALAPMTSPSGRAPLELVAQRSSIQGLGRTQLEQQLSDLCHDVPRLSLTVGDDRRSLVQAGNPALVLVPDLDQALATPLRVDEGEFIRILAAESDGMVTDVGVRLHLALGLDAGDVLAALVDGDSSALQPVGSPMSADAHRLAGEAGSRALLEPWVKAVILPGATQATAGCLDGLDRGPTAVLPVFETQADLSEAAILLAFAEAIGALCDRQALAVERFGPRFDSRPIRIALEPDQRRAMTLIEHQLALTAPMLDTAALELLLQDELDRAGVRLRQFGFSIRDAHQPAPPAWNAVALHVVSSGSSVRARLIYDTAAIDEAAANQLAHQLRRQLGGAEMVGSTPVAVGAMAPDRLSGVPDVATRAVVPRLPGVAATATLANLLDTVSHPEASAALRQAFISCQALRVRPAIDLPRLQKAVGTLVDRHDFLRARFARHDGHWRVLASDGVAPLSVLDFSGASEADLAARAREIALRPYDLARSSLFEVHLLRQGQGGDMVLVRVFEGIGDGWSLGIVLDELLKTYIGLDPGPRPPGMGQIMRLAARSPAASVSSQIDAARLRIGPSRALTLQVRGADTLRRRAMALGTTENGLLAAAFSLALAAVGYDGEGIIGTYDPARSDPRLHRAVGFLSRLVPLELSRNADLVPRARALDAQFLDLSGKAEILGAVPDFIYAPLLPRQMLDHSLFGSVLRKLSLGQAALMSLDVEALDVAPGGLQEGKLQLRPLSLGDRLDLRFNYDMAAFTEAEIVALARNVISHTGLPAEVVAGEILGDVFTASEDRAGFEQASVSK